ncbi:MAG: T9SS type A sorting domain-containing protein [Bacteroidota bacterium]
MLKFRLILLVSLFAGFFLNDAKANCENDITPPIVWLDQPLEITLHCTDTWPEAPNVQYTDNCPDPVSVTYSVNPNAKNHCGYTTKIHTWTIIDAAGNSTSISQTITMCDIEAPEFDNCPEDITVECHPGAPAPALVTAYDDCEGVIDPVFSEEIIPGDCPGNYQVVRTWTATDSHDNSATCTQVITVQDTEAPYPYYYFDENIVTDCNYIPEPYYGFEDYCDPDPTVNITEKFVPGCGVNSYQLVRIYDVTDNCGNYAQYEQTITVEDDDAPYIDVPDWGDEYQYLDGYLGHDYNCSFTALGDPTLVYTGVTFIDGCDNLPESTELYAYDNCGGSYNLGYPEETITYVSDNPMLCGTIYDDECGYIVLRSWGTSDDCGNSAAYTQVLFIVDNEEPTLSAYPPDLTVSFEDLALLPAPPLLEAYDDCSGETFVDFSTWEDNSDLPCYKHIYNQWWTYDDCGNYESHTQVITATDEEAPTITTALALNINATCDDIPEPVEIQGYDNHTDVTSSLSETYINGNPDYDCNYTLVRVYILSDECGNTSNVTQLIHVTDDEAPVFTVLPENDTSYVTCYDLNYGYLPGLYYEVEDNCDDYPYVSYYDNSDGDCVIERTYIAYDNCDNSTFFTHWFVVEDDEAPQWASETSYSTVECDQLEEADELAMYSLITNYNDECSVEFSLTEKILPGSYECPNTYTLLRIWTAYDQCGNSSTHTQSIYVVDTTAPIFKKEGIEFGMGSYTGFYGDDPEYYDYITGYHDCNYAYYDYYNGYYSSCDEYYNSLHVSYDVSYFECDEDLPEPRVLDGWDNCSGDEDVDYEESVFYLDECETLIKRSWRTEDDCYNIRYYFEYFHVSDYTSPSIVLDPYDPAVECLTDPNEIEWGSFEYVYPKNTSVECYVYFGVMNVGDAQVNSYLNVDNLVISGQSTFVEEDFDDNSDFQEGSCSSCDYLGTAYEDNSHFTEGDGSAFLSTSGGELQATLETWMDLSAGYLDDLSGSNAWNGTAYRTYVGLNPGDVLSFDYDFNTDEGNFNDFAFVIVCDANGVIIANTLGYDDELAGCHLADIDASCDNVPAPWNPTGVDNCDEDLESYLDEDMYTSAYDVINEIGYALAEEKFGITSYNDDLCANEYLIRRSYQLVDDCYNHSSAIAHYVFVTDDEAPEFEDFPEDMVLDCGEDLPSTVISPLAYDNCQEAPVPLLFNQETYPNVTYQGYDATKVERTWIAADNCGNVTTQTQTIYLVEDCITDETEMCEYADENGIATVYDAPEAPTVQVTANDLYVMWTPPAEATIAQLRLYSDLGTVSEIITDMNNWPFYQTSTMYLVPGVDYYLQVRYATVQDPCYVASAWSEYTHFVINSSGMVQFEGDTKNLAGDNTLDIYPNPSNGEFTLQTSLEDFSIEVFDLSGKRVFEMMNPNNDIIRLDLTNLERGMYILRATNAQSNLTERIIIK